MSEALLYEFNGVTVEQYNAVNAALGLDPTTGAGDWPAGLLSHTGAGNDAGGVVVFEVWDARASYDAFMTDRLGPALGQAGVPEPARVEWFSVWGQYTR
ncbi:MAG: hypothetical protein QOE45_2450 [Frankiaceae bacterium]|jgi:hypothetical protein|nr:hypothetical protein [Frankiaceae bacterium]